MLSEPPYSITWSARASSDGGIVRPRALTVLREKVDGWRMLAYKDRERVRLVSRNGRDHTRRFADLAAAVAKLSARTLVLDGEVAIYDDQLRSRFEWLRKPDPDLVATPPLFMAFDLLYCDRRDLTRRPLRDRRARLEDIVDGGQLIFPVRRLAPDGLASWKQVVEGGYEVTWPRTRAACTQARPPPSLDAQGRPLNAIRLPELPSHWRS